jgi:hypothetical protein
MNSVYVQVLFIVECELKISHLAVGKVKWGDIKNNTDVISKQIYFRTRSKYMVDYIGVKVFNSS